MVLQVVKRQCVDHDRSRLLEQFGLPFGIVSVIHVRSSFFVVMFVCRLCGDVESVGDGALSSIVS